ncbi:MAG: proline-rich domain-containing protein [Anaerovoracaceae bacterium]
MLSFLRRSSHSPASQPASQTQSGQPSSSSGNVSVTVAQNTSNPNSVPGQNTQGTPSGGSGNPPQGGSVPQTPQPGRFQKWLDARKAKSQAHKDVYKDGGNYIKEAVARRGMTDLFAVDTKKVSTAEKRLNDPSTARTVPPNTDQISGGNAESRMEEVIGGIETAKDTAMEHGGNAYSAVSSFASAFLDEESKPVSDMGIAGGVFGLASGLTGLTGAGLKLWDDPSVENAIDAALALGDATINATSFAGSVGANIAEAGVPIASIVKSTLSVAKDSYALYKTIDGRMDAKAVFKELDSFSNRLDPELHLNTLMIAQENTRKAVYELERAVRHSKPGEEKKAKEKALEEQKKLHVRNVQAYQDYARWMSESSLVKMAVKKSDMDVASASFDVAGDLLSIVSSATELGGVTAPVGVALAALTAVVSLTKMLTLQKMKKHMHQGHVEGLLTERKAHISSAKLGIRMRDNQTGVLPGQVSDEPDIDASIDKGRYAKQADSLTKIEDIVQDIVDETYTRLQSSSDNQKKEKYAVLNVTRDKDREKGLSEKSGHGRETFRNFKHIALYEMGVVDGTRTGISNNMVVNRAADLSIRAVDSYNTPNSKWYERFRTLKLVKEKNAGGTVTTEWKPLEDVVERFGGDKHYKAMIKRDADINPFLKDLAGEGFAEESANTARANVEASMANNSSEKKQLAARNFGGRMLKGDYVESHGKRGLLSSREWK